jgi:hypothetical protein
MKSPVRCLGPLALALCGLGCNGSILGSGDSPGNPAAPGGPGNGGNGNGGPGNGGNGNGGPGNGNQGGPPGGGGPGAGPDCTVGPRAPRLWRLTHLQWKNTVRELFGFTVPVLDSFPAESRLDGFANAAERLQLSPVLFDYYNRAADEIGAELVSRAGQQPQLLGCAVAALGQGTCLRDFLRGAGLKAWRRPLADGELDRLAALYTTAAGDGGPETGLKTVISALLMSPYFTYRTELGDAGVATGGDITLSHYEIASALSYMLWDAPPDAALLQLAAGGKLRDPAVLRSEARRLFSAGGKAPAALHAFVQQWLETEDFTRRPKDAQAFPIFNAELAADLEAETGAFLQQIVFDPGGDRSLKTLLTASFGMLNARTAKVYGATAAGTGMARVELDRAQRRGLLTQASFLGAHAEPVNTSVVNRGRFLREEILCDDVPPPPGDFRFDEKVITEDMTAREKFAVHSKNPSCAACHRLFDVLGFALENYDAIGQWRTTDKNKTIDASGTVPLPSGSDVQFTNFVDLVDQLAKAPDAYGCFAAQYLQYTNGLVKLDSCEKERVQTAFAASGYQLDALVAAVVSSPTFINRRE